MPPVAIPPPLRSQRELAQLLAQIAAAEPFGSQREDLVTSALDQMFSCELRVDRIEATYGAFFDDRYREGRTVRGVPVGTSRFIHAQLLASRNEELDRLARGDLVRFRGIPVRWNGTYEHLEMREAADGRAPGADYA
jgi:hypothetical protein